MYKHKKYATRTSTTITTFLRSTNCFTNYMINRNYDNQHVQFYDFTSTCTTLLKLNSLFNASVFYSTNQRKNI